MQALVLDGFDDTGNNSQRWRAAVVAVLEDRGYSALWLPVARMRIHPCIGCFDCWLKTPGICRYTDDFKSVAQAYIQSRVVLFWTPVIFGTYGGAMKRVLERFIGMMVPFFRNTDGEIHHPARYAVKPAIYAIGWLENAEPEWAELFARLVRRNAVNLLARDCAATVMHTEGDWPKAQRGLSAFLQRCEEAP